MIQDPQYRYRYCIVERSVVQAMTKTQMTGSYDSCGRRIRTSGTSLKAFTCSYLCLFLQQFMAKGQPLWGEGAAFVAQSTIKPRQEGQHCINEIFKIHRLVWIYGCLVVLNVLSMFYLKLNYLLILNFYKCCFIKNDLQKHFYIVGWLYMRQRNPQAMPNGFRNLQPRKKPTAETRQLTKFRDFSQNYLCDFHLRSNQNHTAG